MNNPNILNPSAISKKVGLKFILSMALLFGVASFLISWFFGAKIGIPYSLRYYYFYFRLPGEAFLELGSLERFSWMYKTVVFLLGVLFSVVLWLPIFCIVALIRNFFTSISKGFFINYQKTTKYRVLSKIGKWALISLVMILLLRMAISPALGMALVQLRKTFWIPVRVQSTIEIIPTRLNSPVQARTMAEFVHPISDIFDIQNKNSLEVVNFSRGKEELRGFWGDHVRVCWIYQCEPERIDNDWAAVSAQRKAFLRRLEHRFRVVPGQLVFQKIDQVFWQKEAREVEKLVLDFMNRFVMLDADAEAQGVLRFSADKKLAAYSLEIYHQWGPLSGFGYSNRVILRKTAYGWLIIRFIGEGFWIS